MLWILGGRGNSTDRTNITRFRYKGKKWTRMTCLAWDGGDYAW